MPPFMRSKGDAVMAVAPLKLHKTILRSQLFQTLLAALVAGYIWLVRVTTRWHWWEETESLKAVMKRHPQVIVAFWHQRLLMMPGLRHALPGPMYVMISRHRDGAFITAVCARFGVDAVRGSSRRGGVAALKGAVDKLHDGNVVITPDGPRGPRERVQPGVIALAKTSGLPIIPVAYSVKRGRLMNSWDRFLVPAPFNRGCIAIGTPLYIARDADDDAVDNAAMELQGRLQHVTQRADSEAGRTRLAAEEQ